MYKQIEKNIKELELNIEIGEHRGDWCRVNVMKDQLLQWQSIKQELDKIIDKYEEEHDKYDTGITTQGFRENGLELNILEQFLEDLGV